MAMAFFQNCEAMICELRPSLWTKPMDIISFKSSNVVMFHYKLVYSSSVLFSVEG